MAWGITGNIRGPSGVGVESVNDLGSGSFEVVLTDGRTFPFSVPAGVEGIGIDTLTDLGGGSFSIDLTDGRTFTFTAPAGATGATGATGPAGTRGTAWGVDSGVPLVDGELTGDLYLDTSTGDIYQWTP